MCMPPRLCFITQEITQSGEMEYARARKRELELRLRRGVEPGTCAAGKVKCAVMRRVCRMKIHVPLFFSSWDMCVRGSRAREQCVYISLSAELLPPEALTQSAISRFILSTLWLHAFHAHAFLYKTRSRVENVVFYIGYLYTNVFYKFDPLMKIICSFSASTCK